MFLKLSLIMSFKNKKGNLKKFLINLLISTKEKSSISTTSKPDLLSIDNYRNSSNNELSLTNEKLVFKKNGQVKYFLPPHRFN